MHCMLYELLSHFIDLIRKQLLQSNDDSKEPSEGYLIPCTMQHYLKAEIEQVYVIAKLNRKVILLKVILKENRNKNNEKVCNAILYLPHFMSYLFLINFLLCSVIIMLSKKHIC